MKEIYKNVSTGKVYRVIYRDYSTVILHEMNDTANCSLEIHDISEFRGDPLKTGWEKQSDPALSEESLSKWDCATEQMKEKAVKKYGYVQKFLNKAGLDFFDSKKRGELISKFSKKHNLAVKTFKRWLSRFFSFGMNERALLEDYSTGSSRKKRVYKNKPGPKTANTLAPADYETKVERYLRQHYLDPSSPSLETVRRNMNNDLFTDSEGRLMVNRPSYKAVRRIKDKLDIKKTEIARTSEPFYFNNKKPVRDNTRSDVLFPYDRVEYDVTILPIYLRSELNNRCVGKPYLTLIVDVATRMILGMSVSLENASYENAIREAFLNMLTPKDEYARMFGLDIDFDDWPVAYYIPNSSLGDKGETFNLLSNSLPEVLDMELKNAVSYKARQKPVVENLFNDFSDYVRQNFPGAVLEHLSQRERRDYRKEAQLTLSQLTTELIDFAILLNKKTVKFPTVPKEVITENVRCSPLELFKFGMQFQQGSLRAVDPEEIKYYILPEAEATLSKQGIRRPKNKRYVSDDPDTESWILEKLRGKSSVKVKIRYSSLDPRKIFVVDKDQLIPFRLDSKQEYLGKVTDAEYDILYADFLELNKEDKEIDDQLYNDLITSRRKRMKKIRMDSNGLPADIRDISINRAVEKAVQRKPVFDEEQEEDLEIPADSEEDEMTELEKYMADLYKDEAESYGQE